ncbi:uncharacterized protein BO80DRAFT_465724 [Aspergillus ibericus CBS 121593]|uniref:Uncharacterized protein n=1 Tax=Aspergillus ibericus CBS 121593 TaxID=1448316 RepID=A0A395GWQ5_9EURO|nr:hypothetical protein BO80DRAFT_465724 [Aspergillus ibericus CBS 121593]RAL00011.1 hypothetical protein BO80DRAFT_465724 [Aspergillus ibericus CBS 121593]
MIMPQLPCMFQSPRKWTAEHLKALRLCRHHDSSIQEIVGVGYVPKDGDEEFESLATEFAQPTEHELLSYLAEGPHYRRNIFMQTFGSLSEVAHSKTSFVASRDAVLSLFKMLLVNVETKKHLTISSRGQIPFEVAGIRGALSCSGSLIDSSIPRSPLASFIVIRDGDHNIAREVSHLLLQGALANASNQTRRAFVICMAGVNLQITMAKFHFDYMDALVHGKNPDRCLDLLHSEWYNLCNRERRKEALRAIVGLARLLDTQ